MDRPQKTKTKNLWEYYNGYNHFLGRYEFDLRFLFPVHHVRRESGILSSKNRKETVK